jgi:ribosomal protein S18 acetylase RimI-like enzyme
MTLLTIRSITLSDIRALSQLMAATPLWQRHGVTEASAARRLQTGLEGGATIDVAEIESKAGRVVVGFVWYATRGIFLRSGYISLIGVYEELRGRGIGEALMQQAEQQMFAEVNEVFLLVSDFNQAAQRFYQRIGYVQVGAIPDYLTPGVTELLLMKRRRGIG